MHLTFDNHRVDPSTAIVQRIELADFSCAGIDINFHHTDIGSERIGHVWRVIITDRFQTRLDTRDCLII